MASKGGKFRAKGVKREHNIIHGLLPILEEIAAHPKVTAVIPGRISVTRSNTPGARVRLQTSTLSGIKLGARSGSAAQEVFVVTAEPDQVIEDLRHIIAEGEKGEKGKREKGKDGDGL